VGHEPWHEYAKNEMQQNDKVDIVNLTSSCSDGKKILDIFRLKMSHDVD
jgi:hypothetical protein